MSKKLSKHILPTANGEISIMSFTSFVGLPLGITTAAFTFVFSLTTGTIKKLLKITRKKTKKHKEIVMLAKSKLNSIENLMSQGLIDLEISLEEFKKVVNEKGKYERIKENIRNVEILTMKLRDKR